MKSRRLLLSTASYLAVTGIAYAADMTPVVKAPPRPVVPSWTGFYMGIHGGVAGFNAKQDTHVTPGSQHTQPEGLCEDVFTGTCRFSDTSGALGGQAGYNWQMQNWVLGVEGDGSWLNAKASVFFPTGNNRTDGTASNKLDWLASARARLGFVVADGAALIYGTGGVAWAGINSGWIENAGYNALLNKTLTGWVAGGGVEAIVSRNWTFRVEALWYDFGSKFATGTGGPALDELATYTTKFNNTVLVGRVGLNFKW